MFTRLVVHIGCLAAVGLGFLVSGCVVIDGDVQSVFTAGRKEAERDEVLSRPLLHRRTLKIESSFGTIEVRGAETRECRVQARVHARAKSLSQAQHLLDQATLHLDETPTGLHLHLEKPTMEKGESLGASFVVLVPHETELDCQTSFGKIEVRDIASAVKAHTGFAGIRCEAVTGALDLQSQHGDIRCRDILSTQMNLRTSYGTIELLCLDLEAYQEPGTARIRTQHGKILVENLAAKKIEAHTSFGDIDLHCSPMDIASLQADLETSYGSIDFDTPGGFAGHVHMTTSYGSVKTRFPVTVEGKASTSRLLGQIGQGDGALRLHTSFGSIMLR